MDVKSFIIGLGLFILAMIVTTSFVIDLYGEDGYEVDLTLDENTKLLNNLSQQAQIYKSDTIGATDSIYSGLPGENDSYFNAQDGYNSDAELQMSALSAISNLKGMLGIFTSMLVGTFGLLGLDVGTTEAYIWFFGILVIVPLMFILISAFVRNPIL